MATAVLHVTGFSFFSDGTPPYTSTAWDDSSDATYTEVFDAADPGIGSTAFVIPTIAAVPAMRGGEVTGVSAVIRASAVSTDTVFLTIQQTGYWPTDTFVHPDSSVADFVWAATTVNNGNALANDIGFGTFAPQVISTTSTHDHTQFVYELVMTVEYIPAQHVPPRRQYPYPGTRVYPPVFTTRGGSAAIV